MTMVKKVLLADDTVMHRTLLRSVLGNVGPEIGVKFEILAEGENGAQLVALYAQQAPGSVDIVFSDIRMPEMDGLSALVKIKQLNPAQKVIMVSSESVQTMDQANAAMGEQARRAMEQAQKMEMLEKVAVRLRNNQVEEGKTNSILVGCEKLLLDPVPVAQHFGARGYIRKPYNSVQTKELLEGILIHNSSKFLIKD